MLLTLSGCDQRAFLEKFTPKEEVEFSKQFWALLQKRDFNAVEQKISPDIKTAGLRPTLDKMAAFFPKEQAKNINIVGCHIFTDKNLQRADITLQYEFPSEWLLTNLVLEKKGEVLLVKGMHVRPLPASLEIINQFTFQGKGVINYIFLSLAILVVSLIIIALVLCIKTPIPKRKWLWIIFILVGFVKVTLNWTTGELGITPVSFLIPGSGIERSGPYVPWLLETSLPLGAILFLVKRKKWRMPPGEPETKDTARLNAEGGD